MQTKTTPAATVDQVAGWRCQQLVAVGFSLAPAAEIAGDPRFDLHVLIALVENHCPPDLAVRILAPLEPENAT